MKRLFTILVILIAMNANAQWVQMSNGIGTDKIVYCFASIGNNIFAGTLGSGIFTTTNNGNNWTAINNGIVTINSITTFAVSGTNIFAGSNGSGVYLSTNNGSSWASVNSGLTNTNVWSLAISGSNIFAGTYGGVFLSTNNGSNWVSVGLTTFHFYSLAASESYIYAGATPTIYPNTGGVLLSSNNGTNWTQPFIGLNIDEISISGTYIFGGTNGAGLVLSTNNGLNWNTINNGLTNLYISAITISGINIFLGTDEGVFLSTNNGAIWTQKNQGFNIIPRVDALITSNGYIFAGTFGQSIWRRSLSEIISIQNISTEIPLKYSLGQNYPNPFNSTSNLKFQIVNTGDVKLIVYDIMGKEVQTLVKDRLQPGTYEAAFDGSALNSGVYFYKLITNGFTQTKKMLLIK